MRKPSLATLPLGVDLGRKRLRVALAGLDNRGRPRLAAVATRDLDSNVGAALRDAHRELATTERRCVVGVTHPDAIMRAITLPAMSRFERHRAASFQAERYIDYPLDQAIVSVNAIDGDERWAVGIARRSAITSRLAIVRAARLRAIAVDDAALALARVYGDYDGTIDMSDDVTRITLFARPLPFVADAAIGANVLTEGIARSLGIDALAAEERKRSIGFAGAGEMQRDQVIDAIANMLAAARAAGVHEPRRLVMVGNGSRVPGFSEAIERRIGCGVRLASLSNDVSETLPPDVLRAAGVDWSIAFGLSLWATAS